MKKKFAGIIVEEDEEGEEELLFSRSTRSVGDDALFMPCLGGRSLDSEEPKKDPSPIFKKDQHKKDPSPQASPKDEREKEKEEKTDPVENAPRNQSDLPSYERREKTRDNFPAHIPRRPFKNFVVLRREEEEKMYPQTRAFHQRQDKDKQNTANHGRNVRRREKNGRRPPKLMDSSRQFDPRNERSYQRNDRRRGGNQRSRGRNRNHRRDDQNRKLMKDTRNGERRKGKKDSEPDYQYQSYNRRNGHRGRIGLRKSRGGRGRRRPERLDIVESKIACIRRNCPEVTRTRVIKLLEKYGTVNRVIESLNEKNGTSKNETPEKTGSELSPAPAPKGTHYFSPNTHDHLWHTAQSNGLSRHQFSQIVRKYGTDLHVLAEITRVANGGSEEEEDERSRKGGNEKRKRKGGNEKNRRKGGNRKRRRRRRRREYDDSEESEESESEESEESEDESKDSEEEEKSRPRFYNRDYDEHMVNQKELRAELRGVEDKIRKAKRSLRDIGSSTNFHFSLRKRELRENLDRLKRVQAECIRDLNMVTKKLKDDDFQFEKSNYERLPLGKMDVHGATTVEFRAMFMEMYRKIEKQNKKKAEKDKIRVIQVITGHGKNRRRKGISELSALRRGLERFCRDSGFKYKNDIGRNGKINEGKYLVDISRRAVSEWEKKKKKEER